MAGGEGGGTATGAWRQVVSSPALLAKIFDATGNRSHDAPRRVLHMPFGEQPANALALGMLQRGNSLESLTALVAGHQIIFKSAELPLRLIFLAGHQLPIILTVMLGFCFVIRKLKKSL